MAQYQFSFLRRISDFGVVAVDHLLRVHHTDRVRYHAQQDHVVVENSPGCMVSGCKKKSSIFNILSAKPLSNLLC